MYSKMLQQLFFKQLPVTTSLVAATVVITLLTEFGSNLDFLWVLIISKTMIQALEILNGEVWRLWTPTFIHFSIYHLVFNLLWVWIIGGAIERKQGSMTLLFLYLVSAAISNYAEFVFSGPMFGGMSGYAYALFGYLWMQSKFNPAEYRSVVPSAIIALALVWFVVCWVGLIGNVANYAHTAGLIIGIIWGRFDARRPNIQRKRFSE